MLDAIHGQQLRVFGGRRGIRSANAVETALNEPRRSWAESPKEDLPAIAARYAVEIARNPAFIDGNERLALSAMATFLSLNGMELRAGEEETVVVIREMAGGRMSETRVRQWLVANISPR